MEGQSIDFMVFVDVYYLFIVIIGFEMRVELFFCVLGVEILGEIMV